ncbi:MAG: glutamate--tRNA ligase [Acidibrevibacterium sp.]|uniref:glutamate--tRNA ligase n=1 Tax=Acidibrevibacterium fodinaquatile TaxID=1969806 RepID=UPI0023A816BA|nr:glutamate--tRNA ligase [Acidibrevibacterium fodinaquatile]MCA7119636.1 glutamate--tRNA ligase [Acidibrevibacterium fodinaquatile]
MSAAVRVRFAPSPTGHLHVGNARIALANFLFARRHGGHFLLRLDDTDRERSRPEFAEAITQDLRWLGLDWDATFRQSDRLDRYRAAAERLRASGRLYPCFESEEELRAKREARLKRGLAPVYDRAMLHLTPAQREAAEAGGKRPYWRFRLSDGAIAWNDLVLGARQVKLGAVSDPVLIRADETPLYTFTSVVDDLAEGITHIIRGEDHITNTGVQIDLLAALGGDPTALGFAHLPLLTDSDGGKLSKRLQSLSLRTLRRDGIEPMALAAYLARLGSSADPEPLPLATLAAHFDLGAFSASAARFDLRQLLALNRRVLHGLAFAEVASRLPAGATAPFWQAVRGNLDFLREAEDWWAVVGGEIETPALPEEAAFLVLAADQLPPEPWDETIWRRWTDALKDASGRRGRALFHPLRLALTGAEEGPELAALLPLIGRARALARLRAAARVAP